MSSRATLGIAVVLFVLALFGPWNQLPGELLAELATDGPQVESGTVTHVAETITTVVNHGLGFTPSRVLLTPQGEHSVSWWVTGKNAASFEIHTSATSTTDLIFDWRAEE